MKGKHLSIEEMIELEQLITRIEKEYQEYTNEKIGNINEFEYEKVLKFYGGRIVSKDIYEETGYTKIMRKVSKDSFYIITDTKYLDALKKAGLAKYNEFVLKSLFQYLTSKKFKSTNNGDIFLKEYDQVVNCYEIKEEPKKKNVFQKIKNTIKGNN